jgi:hypothetical protein
VSSTNYLLLIEKKHPALAIPLGLLVLLALFPPETRGESMVVAAGLIALLALWIRRSGGLAIVVAAAVAIPAALASGSPAAAVQPLAVIFIALTLGFTAAAIEDRGWLVRAAAVMLAISGSLAALHALYQKLWGLQRLSEMVATNPALPDHAVLLGRIERERAYAAFSTPAALGCYLALTMAVTFGLALSDRGRRRVLWSVLLAAQLGGFLAAASATALAALVGAVALASLRWRAGRRFVLVSILAAAVVVVGLILLRGDEILSASHRNSPWRLRAGNFRAAWSMAQDHPWTGVGPGGFAERYPEYRRPGDNETRHVHNLALEMAAEYGWAGGLLISAVFFYCFLRPLLRRRSKLPPHAAAMAVGLAAFAIHNLADYTAYMPSLMWLAALLCGLCWSSAARPPRILAGASLAVVVIAAILAGMSGHAANHRHAARMAAFAGDTARAERSAGKAALWAPWDADAALLLLRSSLDGEPLERADEARRTTALRRADRAVRLAPYRPAARELRAMVRVSLGDYPGAYADLAEASRLYPMSGEYAANRDMLRRLVEEAMRGEGTAP